jgi:hypothetical protein
MRRYSAAPWLKESFDHTRRMCSFTTDGRSWSCKIKGSIRCPHCTQRRTVGICSPV